MFDNMDFALCLTTWTLLYAWPHVLCVVWHVVMYFDLCLTIWTLLYVWLHESRGSIVTGFLRLISIYEKWCSDYRANFLGFALYTYIWNNYYHFYHSALLIIHIYSTSPLFRNFLFFPFPFLVFFFLPSFGWSASSPQSLLSTSLLSHWSEVRERSSRVRVAVRVMGSQSLQLLTGT